MRRTLAPSADCLCHCFSGGDGRPGGEQIPERGAQAVHLWTLQRRVGQAGPVGCQTSGLLHQCALACASATTLVSNPSGGKYDTTFTQVLYLNIEAFQPHATLYFYATTKIF